MENMASGIKASLEYFMEKWLGQVRLIWSFGCCSSVQRKKKGLKKVARLVKTHKGPGMSVGHSCDWAIVLCPTLNTTRKAEVKESRRPSRIACPQINIDQVIICKLYQSGCSG